jgi:hypothetical protein
MNGSASTTIETKTRTKVSTSATSPAPADRAAMTAPASSARTPPATSGSDTRRSRRSPTLPIRCSTALTATS